MPISFSLFLSRLSRLARSLSLSLFAAHREAKISYTLVTALHACSCTLQQLCIYYSTEERSKAKYTPLSVSRVPTH